MACESLARESMARESMAREGNQYEPRPSRTGVAKQNKGPGIQSAAGLIRYFDAEEDTNFKLPPSAVVIFSILVGVGVVALKIFWKYA